MGRIPIAEVCECDTMHNNEADYLSMASPLTLAWKCQTVGNWPLTLLTDKSRSESTPPPPLSPKHYVRITPNPPKKDSFSRPATLSSTNLYLPARPCS